MILFKKIKSFFIRETNVDWKVVALDLHQALIEAEERIRGEKKCLNHQ
jgi:hypothetical protein